MVTEVTAFRADDGSIHTSERAALEHDALEKLKKLDVFNHGTALAVTKQCEHIVTILQPLADHINSLGQDKAAK
jgi:hypothetical protein